MRPISPSARPCTRVLIALCLLFSLPAFAQPAFSVFYSAPSKVFGINTLMLASDGNFYASITYGGDTSCSLGCGSVIRLTPAGVVTTVHSFTLAQGGYWPVGQLMEAGDGNLYGVTYRDGIDSDNGYIFSLSLAGAYTALHQFGSFSQGGSNASFPEVGGLIQGSNGSLFGTAPGEGAHLYGYLFSYDMDGTFTDLYDFSGGAAGDVPQGKLLQADDGNFYGTTAGGGSASGGTFFQYKPSGSFAITYNFPELEGEYPAFPLGGLVEAGNGLMYGTTFNGGTGTNTFGNLYSMSKSGGFVQLFEFTADSGYEPYNGVYLATDGNLYGSLYYGSTSNQSAGLVFESTLSGAVSPIFLFPFDSSTDGADPTTALIQGPDGNLYGTSEPDTQPDGGRVFELSFSPAIAAPIILAPLGDPSVVLGTPVTLDWSVANAFSTTAQQCYAFVQNNATGAGGWSGKQTGSYSSSTGAYLGSASVTPTAVGTYTYALTCAGTESGFTTLTVTANEKNDTTTAFAASPNPVSVGQPVTLTATVTKTSGSATPTGTISFYDGSVYLGSANLNSSAVAAVVASSNGYPPGTYTLTAKYSGDTNYNASTSPATAVFLDPAPTATALTVAPTTLTPPASATLTATVTRSAAGATGTPSGSVTFYADGSFAIGTVKLSTKGIATLTHSTSGIAAGMYSITANYKGDLYDAGSTSSATVVTVK